MRLPAAPEPIIKLAQHRGSNLIIYGVALLSFCLLVGVYAGYLIGLLFGVEVNGAPANIGGVGIAMILLIVITNYCGKYVRIDQITSGGVTFWSAMYIPIVVAMAAKQDVLGAVSGGPVAILAGLLAVAVSFVLIPFMSRFGSAPAVEADNKAGES